MNVEDARLMFKRLDARLRSGLLTRADHEMLNTAWVLMINDLCSLNEAADLTGRAKRTLWYHVDKQSCLLPSVVLDGKATAIYRPALGILYPDVRDKLK